MELHYFAILVASGVAIGFISGLLGIGGGIIMTPVQYWIYTSAGMDPDVAIKLAIATSLAVILPTAASGVLQHRRKVIIDWKAVSIIGIFTAIGSFFGAAIASHLPGQALKIIFGIMAILVAIRMLTLKVKEGEKPARQSVWIWIAVAIPIGMLTGILGVGGGVLMIPALVLILRFPLRQAVGNSLAIMLFTATGGIIGYIINGGGAPDLPFSTGYIWWPAWLALVITSMPMAQVGAITAHKVKTRVLNIVFVVLLVYIGLDMLGFVDFMVNLISQ